MSEPDDVMGGAPWPPNWQTGWVSWRYVDMVGVPVVGTVTLSLSVLRAVSTLFHTTVYGGNRVVTLVNGKPSGSFVTVNAAGDPCIELPLGDDADIQPTGIQVLARESWSGQVLRRTLTAEHTLDNPLWLSGDLSSVAAQPGVVAKIIWVVPLEASGPAPDAQVGDWILYQDTGRLTELVEL